MSVVVMREEREERSMKLSDLCANVRGQMFDNMSQGVSQGEVEKRDARWGRRGGA